MRDFVPDDRRDLVGRGRPDNETGPYLHHPGRGHRCIKAGVSHEVDAEVVAVVASHLADDTAYIVDEFRVTDQKCGLVEASFHFLEFHPQSFLISRFLGMISRRNQMIDIFFKRVGISDRKCCRQAENDCPRPSHSTSPTPRFVGIS